ncbi:MAG: heparan-alpha-glucosaminide N-acetyltransferase domain-containing protein [Bacillota bacterium]|nr:heparan-alpha-glucosaminide N-acetyltransferase domain-containing protein [Bacillota bacterium]
MEENAVISKQKKSRIWEIDFLRGFCILLMVVDHFFWDLTYIRSIASSIFSNYGQIDQSTLMDWQQLGSAYWSWPVRVYAHYIVSALFFILSGISCCLSKNNFIHSLKIIIGSIIFQAATWVIYFVAYNNNQPGQIVAIFNVLLALGVGVLAVALLRKIKIPYHGQFMIALGLIIFIVSMAFNLYSIQLLSTDWYGSKWFYGWIKWDDVGALLIGRECWGSDYFPIIPCLAYTFIGCGIGELVYEKRKTSLMPRGDNFWHKPLSFLGRYTMWVYLLHQVVLFAGLIIACLCLGYRF